MSRFGSGSPWLGTENLARGSTQQKVKVMGIEEIAVFTAFNQLSQAVGAYLTRTQGTPTSYYAIAAIKVGIQLCAAVTKATSYAIAAASAEFATTQGAESSVVSALKGLPPIT